MQRENTDEKKIIEDTFTYQCAIYLRRCTSMLNAHTQTFTLDIRVKYI